MVASESALKLRPCVLDFCQRALKLQQVAPISRFHNAWIDRGQVAWPYGLKSNDSQLPISVCILPTIRITGIYIRFRWESEMPSIMWKQGSIDWKAEKLGWAELSRIRGWAQRSSHQWFDHVASPQRNLIRASQCLSLVMDSNARHFKVERNARWGKTTFALLPLW